VILLLRNPPILLKCFILSENDSRLKDMNMRICYQRAQWTILETRENFSMVRHLLKQVNLLHQDSRQQRLNHLLYLRNISTIPTSGTLSRRAWATKNRPEPPLPEVQEMLMAESIMQWRLIMSLTRTSLRGKTLASDSTYQTSIMSLWIQMSEVRPRRSTRLDLSLMKVSLGPLVHKCNNQL